MTGKTHRVGGMLCCLTGFSILYNKGLLINNVSPIVQLAVIYPFAIYGSMVSDMDQNWNSTPSKDIVSWCIYRVLHLATPVRKFCEKRKSFLKKIGKSKILGLFDAKHRSWQTHSDIFLLGMIGLFLYLINRQAGTADSIILMLIATGLILGVISHLILDSITPEGFMSLLLTPVKKIAGSDKPFIIHFVPNTPFFATGGPWEKFVRKVLWLLTFIALLVVIYLLSPYRVNILG